MNVRTVATYGKHALDPYRVRYYVPGSNRWFQSEGFETLSEAEKFVLLMLDGEATKAKIIEVQSW